jgi:hypothetical protein
MSYLYGFFGVMTVVLESLRTDKSALRYRRLRAPRALATPKKIIPGSRAGVGIAVASKLLTTKAALPPVLSIVSNRKANRSFALTGIETCPDCKLELLSLSWNGIPLRK